MRIIIFLCTIMLLVACKDRLITTYYETGEQKETYEYKGDSLRHGAYTTYDEKGKILERAQYKDGKLHGTREIFLDDRVSVLETYKEDVFHGDYKEFYPDGTLKFEGRYTEGKLSGIMKGYYPSGHIKEEVTFQDNIENGPFKEYHDGGGVSWEGTYLKGDNEFGILKNYDKEGNLIKKMLCDSNARCTTTWQKDELKTKIDE